MDITALTFVTLPMLTLVFFGWWGKTDHPGLPGWANARAASKPQGRREVKAAPREIHRYNPRVFL